MCWFINLTIITTIQSEYILYKRADITGKHFNACNHCSYKRKQKKKKNKQNITQANSGPLTWKTVKHFKRSCRFLLPAKYWVLSPMCSVPSAWMREACTPSFSASPLSDSSKCFCLLTTCLQCDDGVALTLWVRFPCCLFFVFGVFFVFACEPRFIA